MPPEASDTRRAACRVAATGRMLCGHPVRESWGGRPAAGDGLSAVWLAARGTGGNDRAVFSAWECATDAPVLAPGRVVWGTCGPRSRSRSGHAARRVSLTAERPTREPAAFPHTGLGDACPVWPTMRSLPINLRYLSTSLLWWQAVVGMIGGPSSHALRMHAPYTWRRSTGWPNVDHTAIRRVRSPLRLCGSVTAEVHGGPRGVVPIRRLARAQGHPGGAPGRSNNPIASPCLMRRCPPVSPLFASWTWLLHTGCLLEALDMTVP